MHVEVRRKEVRGAVSRPCPSLTSREVQPVAMRIDRRVVELVTSHRLADGHDGVFASRAGESVSKRQPGRHRTLRIDDATELVPVQALGEPEKATAFCPRD